MYVLLVFHLTSPLISDVKNKLGQVSIVTVPKRPLFVTNASPP